MKPVKGKIISIAALVYVFLSVAALLAAVPVQASEVMKNSAEKIYIEGAASVDGGEWTQTVPDRMTDDRFHRAVFRGRLSQPLEDGNRLVFRSGGETARRWKDRSRSESWTPEKREAARRKALERSGRNG